MSTGGSIIAGGGGGGNTSGSQSLPRMGSTPRGLGVKEFAEDIAKIYEAQEKLRNENRSLLTQIRKHEAKIGGMEVIIVAGFVVVIVMVVTVLVMVVLDWTDSNNQLIKSNNDLTNQLKYNHSDVGSLESNEFLTR